MKNRITRTYCLLFLGIATVLCLAPFFSEQSRNLEAPVKPLGDPIESSQASPTYHARLLELKQRSHTKILDYADAEIERWRAEFPWKPTSDPDVVITQRILDSTYAEPEVINHGFLVGFFKNEARFTPQFKKFYEIVSEYDRNDNPVAVAQSYQNLWTLHEILTHDPEEPVLNSDGSQATYRDMWEPGKEKLLTYGVWAEHHWESIGGNLQTQSAWPEKDPDQVTPPKIELITRRLFEEVPGMDTIPNPRFTYNGDYEDDLQVGDVPLVPRIGWQAAHDGWEESVKDQVFDFAYLIDPDGNRHRLGKDSDGNFVSPLTAEEIERFNGR